MFVVINPHQISIPPGTIVQLEGTWKQYLDLYSLLSDRSLPKIKYTNNKITLMNPLPDHGKRTNLLADIIKAILEYKDIEYEALTPITLSLPEVTGIEPDYCFYVENKDSIQGKTRIDWETDPPPDLAIEIHVTSYTDINDFIPFKIPEVWILKEDELNIYQFNSKNNIYLNVENSKYLPNTKSIVKEIIQFAYQTNTSRAIKYFRNYLKKIENNM